MTGQVTRPSPLPKGKADPLYSPSNSVHLLLFLVRKPTAMLDHVLTFHLLHLIVTTVWVRSLPSWWYYPLAALHAAGCVISSEALAVKREMRDGFNAPVWEVDDLTAQHDDTSRRDVQLGAESGHSDRLGRPRFVVDEDDADDHAQTLFEAPSHLLSATEDEKGLEQMELKTLHRND